MSWLEALRPASFRGIPFSVAQGEAELTRRIAVHEYPWRDDVWPEDLGAGRNTYALRGWVVGDDAIAQRDQLIEALDDGGPGELIHPTFGSLQVACIGFRAGEDRDNGRVIDLDMLFVKGGARQFPASVAATADGVASAAAAAEDASQKSFLARLKDTIKSGAQTITGIVRTAQSYAGAAQRLVGDAARVVHSVGAVVPGLEKSLGRYIRGARSILGSVSSGVGTVQGYITRAATARSNVEKLSSDLTAAAKRL